MRPPFSYQEETSFRFAVLAADSFGCSCLPLGAFALTIISYAPIPKDITFIGRKL